LQNTQKETRAEPLLTSQHTEAAPDSTSALSVSKAALETVLSEITRSHLIITSGIVGLLFLVVALVDLILIENQWLATKNLLSGLLLGSIFFLLNRRRFRPTTVYRWTLVIAIIVLLNRQISVIVRDRPEINYLMFLLLVSGFIVLSTRHYLIVVGLTTGAWICQLLSLNAFQEHLSATLGLLTAVVVGRLINYARVQSAKRTETLKLKEHERFLELEKALAATAEAHRAAEQARVELTTALQAAQENERRYREVFENSEGMILTHDADGQMLTANPSTLHHMGWAVEEIPQRNICEIFACGGSSEYEDYQRQLQTNHSGQGVMRIVTSDGRVESWLYRSSRCETSGQSPFILCTAQDISDRIEAEEKLRLAHRELEKRVARRTRDLSSTNAALRAEVAERQRAEAELRDFAIRLKDSNQELQDFASIASHDLQEPLRKVRSFGDRLLHQHSASLNDAGRDYLMRMLNSTTRMQTLIDDLLSYSRVTTKARPFRQTNLQTVLSEVLSDLEVRIEQTCGTVVVGELPEIDADATQMRQVFQNLIGNALKFHQQDVAPVVNIQARPLHNESGDILSWQMEIADNGIGFDEKYLDRIFTIFQRLHGRDQYEGTGIGLAVTKKIIERHHGTITAHSTPGQGATFIITLPARIQTDQPSAAHAVTSG
jgi:PAS domain S-box-containing protein